jgi:palmitoyl-protein thioesterase
MFHGFGDMCLNPGIKNIDKIISEGTGAPVHCIETGLPSFGEVFANFESVAKKACEKVAAHPDFQGEFNVIGLSQGGLLARYMTEECDMKGKVRNMLTIGGPHMGVDAVPHCFHGIFCDALNFVIKKLVYIPIAQNMVSPAGYFRDIANFASYQRNSVFLPALNNEEVESGDMAKLRKERFSNLNAVMLIKFDKDTMIYPKETAWFQQLDDSNTGTVLPLNSTDFYNMDKIGLKTLTEAGKVDYHSLPGDHLRFTTDDVKNTMIPFLLK